MITDVETLSTADLVSATRTTNPPRDADPSPALPMTTNDGEALAPLFQPEQAQAFRATWDTVQIGFVDDPTLAVRHADELVAQVMKTLAESFASERAGLERQLDPADHASTENLRIALRRYRSFFQRLLAI